jgi:hypothetical protein
MSHHLAPIDTGLLPPSGGRRPCRFAAYKHIETRRQEGGGAGNIAYEATGNKIT